jgi:hypothetical protein
VGCCNLKLFNILLFVLLFSPLVSGLGVAPGSIHLVEGASSFQFKIFNNENLDLKIFFEIVGDDFIELEHFEYVFEKDESDKVFIAKIKDNNYSISQQANIIVREIRDSSSQINVNLGLFLPVSLLVFEQEAFLESSLNVPLRNNFGAGPYVVSLRNLGLNDASGKARIVVDDKEISQSFFVKGKESEQLLLSFNDVFPKGEYDVDLFIDYDNKSLNYSSKMYSGSPFFNISKLNMLGFQNNILSLDAIIISDWPEKIDGLSVFASASDSEFESRTFSLESFGEISIPVFVDVVEDDFVLYLRINDYESIAFDVSIRGGVVFIDGVAQLHEQSNSLTFLFVIIVLFLLIFFVIFKSDVLKSGVMKKN